MTILPNGDTPSIFFRVAERVISPLSRAIYRLRPNNSHGKETKTASEERKKPEMKPFHERYREERTIPPLPFSKRRNDALLYGPLVSLKALASAHPEPSQPQYQYHTSKLHL